MEEEVRLVGEVLVEGRARAFGPLGDRLDASPVVALRIEHAENDYLETLAEMGVPGLALSVAGLALLLAAAGRGVATVRLLYLLLVFYLVVHSVMMGSPRFRTPLDPALDRVVALKLRRNDAGGPMVSGRDFIAEARTNATRPFMGRVVLTTCLDFTMKLPEKSGAR